MRDAMARHFAGQAAVRPALVRYRCLRHTWACMRPSFEVGGQGRGEGFTVQHEEEKDGALVAWLAARPEVQRALAAPPDPHLLHDPEPWPRPLNLGPDPDPDPDPDPGSDHGVGAPPRPSPYPRPDLLQPWLQLSLKEQTALEPSGLVAGAILSGLWARNIRARLGTHHAPPRPTTPHHTPLHSITIHQVGNSRRWAAPRRPSGARRAVSTAQATAEE